MDSSTLTDLNPVIFVLFLFLSGQCICAVGCHSKFCLKENAAATLYDETKWINYASNFQFSLNVSSLDSFDQMEYDDTIHYFPHNGFVCPPL